MAETHVISGLVSKRSELAGIIAHHNQEITRLSEELSTVDAAIRLFDPGYKVQGIKAKRYQRKNHFFEHGEAHKLILDIVRQHQPIGTSDVADKAMQLKGLTLDGERKAAFNASVYATLKRQKRLGLISGEGKSGSVLLWEVVS